MTSYYKFFNILSNILYLWKLGYTLTNISPHIKKLRTPLLTKNSKNCTNRNQIISFEYLLTSINIFYTFTLIISLNLSISKFSN